MHPDYEYWKNLFLETNRTFLEVENSLLENNTNERTLCGSLAQMLKVKLDKTPYSEYRVDVEFNRNDGKIKTILNDQHEVVSVNCDLIIHSRGQNIAQDNILALEMKKTSQPSERKKTDRDRVRILTKDSFDNIWSYDGRTFPEHVCRYIVGVYYELDIPRRKISMEFYSSGEYVEMTNAEF